MATKKTDETTVKTAAEETTVKAVEVTKTTETKAATSQKSDQGGFCMYIGPSITGVIQYGAVYTGAKQDAKKQLASVIEKYPLAEKLIIPDSTLAIDRIKAKTPGNYLYNIYQKLASGEGGK